MIRVLVCDDSDTARRLVVAALRADPGIEVIGTASNGRDAVEMARLLRPDLITMDVRMPVLDGLRATEEIMRDLPTPIVIVSSSVQAPDLQITFNALRAGALEVIEKPRGGGLASGLAVWQKRLVRTVRAMAEVRVVRRRGNTMPPFVPPSFEPRPKTTQQIRVIAIGASTGGPQILAHVLTRLPRGFALPILCVQHMVPGFLDGFARWLAGETHLKVALAEHAQLVRPGHVHIAPDGAHLRLNGAFQLELGGDPPRGMFRPSVDVLFESVAQVAGPLAMGILLSGMGNDGAGGLLTLRQVGGVTLVQRPETCVVPGMPLAAREIGAAEEELHPDGLVEALTGAWKR